VCDFLESAEKAFKERTRRSCVCSESWPTCTSLDAPAPARPWRLCGVPTGLGRPEYHQPYAAGFRVRPDTFLECLLRFVRLSMPDVATIKV
jgi:hypothetical protein